MYEFLLFRSVYFASQLGNTTRSGDTDLDYRNPAVLEEMKNVVRIWLDIGVDGFRMDAVSASLQRILRRARMTIEKKDFDLLTQVAHIVEDDRFLDEPQISGCDDVDSYDSRTCKKPEKYWLS